MKSLFRWVAAAATTFIFASGCSSVVDRSVSGGPASFDFRRPPCAPSLEPASSDGVDVRYLGAGGLAIGWGGDVLLIGPFFSNPSVFQVGFGRVRWNRQRIHNGLRAIDLEQVRGVLAAHSHYDHVGDLPVILPMLPSDVSVFVNDAGVNLLRPYAREGIYSFEGETDVIRVTDSMRFHAFPSAHAPQLCLFGTRVCYRFASRTQVPASERPWGERGYRDLHQGVPHSFLVELMEGESIRYRIFYSDAAADIKDMVLPSGIAIDLAVLCMASWHFVEGYPGELLAQLRPKHVLVTHYEDFFQHSSTSWRFVPLLTSRSANRFLAEVNAEKTAHPGPPSSDVCGPGNPFWTMPVPGARAVFQPN